MGLFGRKKSTVGLDIGSGFVKLVEVDHSGDQPEVARVAMLPLAADAIVEGEVMDPGLVSETVQGLIEASGIKAKDIVTAVGGHDVIIKKIEMDRMKETDAREVIRWEAEQHVPFDIKSVELDFQILDPDDEELQMEVLLVAAKRELVDDKVLGLDAVRIQPVLAETRRHPGHFGPVVPGFLRDDDGHAAGSPAEVLAEHPCESLRHAVRPADELRRSAALVAVDPGQAAGQADAPGHGVEFRHHHAVLGRKNVRPDDGGAGSVP